jgi:hypothetical protein
MNGMLIKIYKTITAPVDLCGYETWSLTLREEHRLWVFEDRVLRRIFAPQGEEVARSWRKVVMRSFIICTLHQILLG